MYTKKIPFGFLNGRMVTPEDVPQGLACGCICAECAGRLVARHPAKNIVKHFAHHKEGSCVGAYETAIHKAAKQIILNCTEILVPELVSYAYIDDSKYGEHGSARETLQSKVLAVEDVEEESRNYQGIVPDIVAKIAGKVVIVEIAVTHPTEADKLEKLRAIGNPAFEISLSKLPELPSLEQLKELVLNCPTNRAWLFNPKKKELDKHVKSMAENELQQKISTQQQKLAKYNEEKNVYRTLPDKHKVEYDLKTMGITWPQVTFIVGINVTCAFSIQASLEAWQLSIFRRFVHQKNGKSFHKDEVYIWIVERFDLYLSEKIRDAPKIAIYHYLQVLVSLNLIAKTIDYGQYVTHGKAIRDYKR